MRSPARGRGPEKLGSKPHRMAPVLSLDAVGGVAEKCKALVRG